MTSSVHKTPDIVAMALVTLSNFIEGEEHTREEDARFALEILKRHLASYLETGAFPPPTDMPEDEVVRRSLGRDSYLDNRTEEADE